MKVYLITTGEYSDYVVMHVTLDKEKAERYCEIHPDHEIEEYEIDNFDIQKRKYTFRVIKNEYGRISVSLADDREDSKEVHMITNPLYTALVTYVGAETYKEAEKIAQDRFAMYEYTKMMVEEAKWNKGGEEC